MPPEITTPFKFPTARIVLYAREPLPGAVKTRLQGELGKQGCLDLYKAMLERIVATIRHSQLAPMDLWVTSNPSNEYFLSLCNKTNIYTQNDGDLGQKMNFTCQQILQGEGTDALLIVGSDCPAMSQHYLETALSALKQGNDVVLGPAEDGGYVLIGMKRPHAGLFQGIDWGTEQVFRQTIEHLQQLGLSYCALDTLWDVDVPADLGRLHSLDPPLELESGSLS